jgi:type II restriction enzyme
MTKEVWRGTIDATRDSDHTMKFGFEEPQANYSSGSQKARVWTERWVADWAYCPNCGNAKVNQFPANLPVADFYCPSCGDQYELKSQKKAFGRKVADGAFDAKQQRLQAANSPNLMLLSYDLANRSVRNVCVIPRHFFVPEIIEKRKPLAATARRAGWVGSNILLDRIPEAGKVFVVRDGTLESKDGVLAKWQRTLFLRDTNVEARGWLIEVMKCVEQIGKDSFDIDDVYAFERQLSALYPDNKNVKPKIRQQLQYLRNRGYIVFVSRGRYRLRPPE